MSTETDALPTPESIAEYVNQNMRKARRASSMIGMMHQGSAHEIVREDDYKGHHVVIRTTYDIKVDGKEVTGQVILTNAGQVQYHGLPNYSFDSTVELVRALIDNFPEDFEKRKPPSGSRHGAKIESSGVSSTGRNRGPMGGMKREDTGAEGSRRGALKKRSTSKSKR